MDNKITEKAKNIKLIVCDVDGVLTAGDVYFDENQNELKTWSVRDGLGHTILKKIVGDEIKVAWITGRKSQSVENRSKDFGVDYLIQGCLYKRKAIEEILEKENISLDEVAYIGDDLVDLPVIRDAGLGLCPLDAVREVKDVADVVTEAIGGKGVFRCVIELILKARGNWDKAISLFE